MTPSLFDSWEIMSESHLDHGTGRAAALQYLKPLICPYRHIRASCLGKRRAHSGPIVTKHAERSSGLCGRAGSARSGNNLRNGPVCLNLPFQRGKMTFTLAYDSLYFRRELKKWSRLMMVFCPQPVTKVYHSRSGRFIAGYQASFEWAEPC